MRATVIAIDDWESLYIDGEKVCENHRVDNRDLGRFGLLEYVYADETARFVEHVERRGMPQTLDEARELLKS